MQPSSVVPGAPDLGQPYARRAQAFAQRGLIFAWQIVIPALLAGLVLRYLVPRTGHGFAGTIAVLGNEHGLYFYVGVFLVFSALAQYWQSRIPAGWFVLGLSAQVAVTPRARAFKALAFCVALAFTIGAMLLFRARVAQPYEVTSSSMLPTLKPDELIVGNHRAWARDAMPKRGDVIVFRSSAVGFAPGALTVPDMLVKRVIGLPGDKVEMRGGLAVINGWEVPSCDVGDYAYLLNDGSSSETLKGMRGELRLEFLGDEAYLTLYAPAAPFHGYVVQPGEVFVLGDNRGNSLDSRAYNGGRGGGVPREAVEARADWFLSHRDRSGATDLGRLFQPVRAIDADLRYNESLDWEVAREGIQRCLKARPSNAFPPAPAGTASVGTGGGA
jgi:signal peptidase I